MSPLGGGSRDLLVRARSVLLDALEALVEHRDSVIVIGAQAVYLRTGKATVAVAEMTKDSDLALDARRLAEEPLIEEAMRRAGFVLDPVTGQPGAWMSPSGIPVDVMVPEAMAGARGSRSVDLPPHERHSMRRAAGLEATVVDNSDMLIESLSPTDPRQITAKVAGPAALLVAKLHKVGERRDQPDRLVDKDAHDLYRILIAIDTEPLAATLRVLRADELACDATEIALVHLAELFAAGPHALGSVMAARTEEGVGDPDIVAQQCNALAQDLLAAVAN